MCTALRGWRESLMKVSSNNHCKWGFENFLNILFFPLQSSLSLTKAVFSTKSMDMVKLKCLSWTCWHLSFYYCSGVELGCFRLVFDSLFRLQDMQICKWHRHGCSLTVEEKATGSALIISVKAVPQAPRCPSLFLFFVSNKTKDMHLISPRSRAIKSYFCSL